MWACVQTAGIAPGWARGDSATRATVMFVRAIVAGGGQELGLRQRQHQALASFCAAAEPQHVGGLCQARAVRLSRSQSVTWALTPAQNAALAVLRDCQHRAKDDDAAAIPCAPRVAC